MQTNVLEYLESSAQQYADKVIFTGENETVTFSQLRTRAQALCARIAPYFTQGEPVIVMMEKSIGTVVSYLSVLYGGGYYIPIDSDLPALRIQGILEFVDAGLLITDSRSLPVVQAWHFDGKVLVVDSLTEGSESLGPTDRWQSGCDTDAMYVIFTSGSTGTPKGVVTSHRAVIDYIDAFAKTAHITDADVFGNQAPLDYVAAIRDMYLPMKTGASTVLIPKKLFSVPARLFDYLDDNQVTTICWVVSAMCIPAKLKAFAYKVPKYIAKVIFTGAVMPAKYLMEWQLHLPRALYMNNYGPTEITASCTYHIIDHMVSEDEKIPIGRPYHNTGILLLDESGKKITTPNTIGEICVRGTCLASGYFGDPVRTAASFIQNPTNVQYTDPLYKTGDLGSCDENGVLWFHGRMDSQIKHMGHRIEMSEIEHAAKSMPDVEECCCLYDQEKELLYLFYESTSVAPGDMAAYLRKFLPAFMIPRKLIAKEKLPLRFNGKIDMQALKDEMI
jgi:amino acid adenylation domain-containing protein